MKLNDQGVQDIQNGNYNSGLQILERLKKILEVCIVDILEVID